MRRKGNCHKPGSAHGSRGSQTEGPLGGALWYLLPWYPPWDTRFLVQTAPAPGGQMIARIWEAGAHVKPEVVPTLRNAA